MRTIILSWLLHHANRGPKSEKFYAIKDKILKPLPFTAYDIQHIPGIKCRSCGGKGEHPRYSNYPPYHVYDWADCWHCWGGWYKHPQWICLAKVKYGKYTFHRPLKREYVVKNPFTKEEMGFEVSQTPVIEGYIDHSWSKYWEFSRFVLYLFYDRASIAELFKDFGRWHYPNWWSLRRFSNNLVFVYRNGFAVVGSDIARTFKKLLPMYSIEPPQVHYQHSENDDLPF